MGEMTGVCLVTADGGGLSSLVSSPELVNQIDHYVQCSGQYGL